MIDETSQQDNAKRHLSATEDEITAFADLDMSFEDIYTLMVFKALSRKTGYTFISNESISSIVKIGKNETARTIRKLDCFGFIDYKITVDGRRVVFVSDRWKGGAK